MVPVSPEAGEEDSSFPGTATATATETPSVKATRASRLRSLRLKNRGGSSTAEARLLRPREGKVGELLPEVRHHRAAKPLDAAKTAA